MTSKPLIRALCFLTFAASLPLLAGDPSPKNPPAEAAVIPDNAGPAWRVEAGAQWRQMGKTRFHGRSQARLSDLPTASASRGAGTAYRDGFVRPDSTNGSQTWNWGYQHASQVAGNRLTLSGSSSESYTRTRLLSNSLAADADLAGAGFYFLTESPPLARWEGLTLTAALGYSFTREDAGFSGQAFRAERTRTERHSTLRDQFDISGIAVPAAPYAGSFNGPGPVISRAPLSSQRGGGANRVVSREIFSSHLAQSLELDLHSFSLGPRIALDLGPHARVLAGIGAAAHLVSWSAGSREVLHDGSGRALRAWEARASSKDVLPGVYVELGAEWRFHQRWSLNAGLRYDWVERLQGEIAGSDFSSDFSGWTALLGVGYRF